ncbi:hypothetical protein EUX57_26130 [Pseudomonas orientalis]|uniref:Uncharacterized protein n=1 Tax=Pseudomonas orientalis TaxID=76758 RepID=A0A4Q7CTL2_9PSED|nr:hypothetical protein EUX57_26130 [Pseudomonas orientalis]
MWEGACPRWQCVSPCISKLTHRHRGQAPSHLLTDVGLENGAVFGGIHPPQQRISARNAARLDPIEALARD